MWEEEIIDRIQVEAQWPLIARLHDRLFPFTGFDHIRYTARALAENEKGEFAFLHIVGEDFFGVRNHLETCGGGLEEGEYLDQTIVREIREELGYGVRDLQVLGSVIDAYNIINRITYSTFFHVHLDTDDVSSPKRTEEETILIKEIRWYRPEEALEYYRQHQGSPVDILVERRDEAALKYYLENR